ncbi:hypothetical protein HJ588_05485 [Flexivirga sp. ID2601S]|uniref:Uncharacterized protein n=1 Tax=Flexivirga aerilata TaxID=1656889 RepID=A0A849AGP1_9MICO|nr:hypothetical protein [Flexivirga aerilata]NNG38726.1 hypothetical protein [Flexivirga aerilata]
MVQGARGWHDRQVAEAADAWLADARDAAAYGRLVDAVQRRRESLTPVPDVVPDAQPADLPTDAQPPDLPTDRPLTIDELADQRPPSTLGDVVGGSALDADGARAALDRLRRGLG